ncbi:MAG: phosphoenolpyruvate carboxykinase domain-containing protein, partial [Rhodococcus sp.]|nr:phosphoenolpyruvate carboxykinase domain-containing protein [Rhodococcus sp. (in: high G+C Gram-positive bacteria)]
VKRIEGRGARIRDAVCVVPAGSALEIEGLDVSDADITEALAVNIDEWKAEIPLIEEWFDFVGEKLPTGIRDEFEALKQRLA